MRQLDTDNQVKRWREMDKNIEEEKVCVKERERDRETEKQTDRELSTREGQFRDKDKHS